MEFKATSTHLTWPLGQPITLKQVLDRLQITLVDNRGKDCNSLIQMDSSHVDVNVVGSYILTLSAQKPYDKSDSAYLRIHVNVVKAYKHKYHKHIHKHGSKYILLVCLILLITLLGMGIRQHHMKQQQAIQSSQIAQNTKDIKQNEKKDQKLANQVASLRGTLRQYQKDHDETALNNELADLKVENQEKLNNDEASLLNQLISKIQNNPSNIDQYIEALDNSWWQHFMSIFNR